MFVESLDRTTVRIGILPCGGGISRISKVRFLAIKDGNDGPTLVERTYLPPIREVGLDLADLQKVAAPQEDLRVVVSLTTDGEISMPIRLSDFIHGPTVKVHDKNISPSDFQDPKKWCSDVTSIP